ncbi:Arc family DNA-binding protein [Acinetobacter sp. ANC 4280]|uniref:Arc family DNA-binding protein n=1 Tax=Acinetobacter terrae TaxID=2731247 RepID=A0A8E4F7Z7_9GAMM|nr:Arc family DNA-binding protein [Acinetobacter terrae]NNH38082.1 Arc family DNA-binding protein [Acinetobacter terrae]
MLLSGLLHMKQTNLRLPIDLISWVKETAKKRHQSMNAFFITELERLRKEEKSELKKK